MIVNVFVLKFIGLNLDVFVIKKNQTGSQSTEIGILSATDNYQSYTLQTGTALHETDASFEFLIAPNRDVFAIKKNQTGSGSTEIAVLAADNNYQSFSLKTATPLHETDGNFQFLIAENLDVIGIKKNNTGSQTTEICVLSAENMYQSFSLQTGTGQHETNGNFQFALSPNSDRDLFVIKKNGTGSGSTEVFAFSAASNYQEYTLQTATPLHETDHTFTFNITPNRELFIVKKCNTGSGSSEFSIMPL